MAGRNEESMQKIRQMDLEKHYLSNNRNKIFAFYESIESIDELFEFSRKMRTDKARICEIKGNKDIVIVAPTLSSKSKYADWIRTIFKGFHIVFIESEGGKNPYFRVARSYNLGIQAAMKHNPKWVVVSNDDMFIIDEGTKLREELMKLDNKEIDTAWIASEARQREAQGYIGKRRLTLKLLRHITSPKTERIIDKFATDYGIYSYPPKWYENLFIKQVKRHRAVADFCILSANLIRNTIKERGKIYDEDFFNGGEDNLLSMELLEKRGAEIEFRIGSVGQGTFTEGNKPMRDIMNQIFFDYKIKRLYKIFQAQSLHTHNYTLPENATMIRRCTVCNQRKNIII